MEQPANRHAFTKLVKALGTKLLALGITLLQG